MKANHSDPRVGAFEDESEKLARSWMRHDTAWLRDYLVSGVEDPRYNVQSVLSRHFLIHALTDDRFSALMDQEYRFAAAMNWLTGLAIGGADGEDFADILRSLRRGADNVEGDEIPAFLVAAFKSLPTAVGKFVIPNYIESFVIEGASNGGRGLPGQPSLETFCRLWNEALNETPGSNSRLKVVEPACGSANDYRFLHRYGIAGLIEYTGFDLCAKNIDNARALFPGVGFEVGNVFSITAPDKSFDLCFVHDLFEHLSIDGMEKAVKEVCRVTRRGLCVGFFQMAESSDHRVREVGDYYVNTLSMARMRELFGAQGFTGLVIHIGAFLHDRTGCRETHNANAYAFVLAPECHCAPDVTLTSPNDKMLQARSSHC